MQLTFNMKIGIMQPYLFPYIGYWQHINSVDKFVLFDDVNYIKRGWINRNKLRSGRFTISLQGASQNRKIRELVTTGEYDAFYRALDVTYRHAPHWNEVRPLLELNVMGVEYISKIVYMTVKRICHYLDIKTHIVPSSEIYNNETLSGQQRIAHICILEGADMYVNPINGWELYDDALFSQYNIKLRFLKNREESNLSIIDHLMHKSKDEIKQMLNNYEFISKTL